MTPSCERGIYPLRVTRHEGLALRAYVAVKKDDHDAFFLFDTGSAATRLNHGLERSEIVPHAANVRIGCETYAMASGPAAPLEDFDGVPVVGLLGADIVTHYTPELDLRGDIIRIHQQVPNEATRWPAVGIEVVRGVVLTRAKIDGRDVRLLLDTGTDHVLLVTNDPGTGHVATTHDAANNRLALVWAAVRLEWGGAERSVPAWRTRSHPVFERHARAVGGADGILGLSALGNRRLVFDAAKQRLYLEPLSAS